MFQYQNKTNNFIQSPWIELSHYGIPRKDKYHETEASRLYLKAPITDSEFVQFFESLDTSLQTEEFKQKHLGEKYNKYQYTPILRQSITEGYPPYIKLKLDVEGAIIKTKIYKKVNGRREVIPCKTIDDVYLNVPYMSDVVLIPTFTPFTVRPNPSASELIRRSKSWRNSSML